MSAEQNVQMQKFDGTRAAEYEHQSRIALAGYEACHELSACMLMATIGQSAEAEALVAGAGGTPRKL
jgi:tRNA (cmo5U34)-methyltransferase